MAIQSPTTIDLRGYAAAIGLELSEAEIEGLRGLIEPTMDLYRALDTFDDEVLSPQYPRGPASVPTPEENPHKGWSFRIRAEGADSGPLIGRTVALKDNICLVGAPVLNGTAADPDYLPESDATVATRALAHGATITGKAVCEYMCASGGSHTSASGPVRNPHDPAYMAGGSSSGCAVLVASGAVDMAIGTDQGGSIRVPASFCGIVGMKPTHGLVPYTGIIGIDPTLDHAGPMTRSVIDNALLLQTLAGPDGLDPRQNAPCTGDYLSDIEAGVAGLRIGIVKEGFGLPISDPVVDESVRAAAAALGGLGATVENISIPMHAVGALVWVPITAEGAIRTLFQAHGLSTLQRGFYPIDLLDHLARWRESARDWPANVTAIALTALHMNQTYNGRYYAKAQNLLRKVAAAYDDMLSRYDVLVMPTTPMTAPPLPPADADAATTVRLASEPLTNTGVFDATGHPALSVPCGFSGALPIGVMMIGRHYDEPTLYWAARALEKQLALDMHPASPQ